MRTGMYVMVVTSCIVPVLLVVSVLQQTCDFCTGLNYVTTVLVQIS